jgi:uncharacterized protein YceK
MNQLIVLLVVCIMLAGCGNLPTMSAGGPFVLWEIDNDRYALRAEETWPTLEECKKDASGRMMSTAKGPFGYRCYPASFDPRRSPQTSSLAFIAWANPAWEGSPDTRYPQDTFSTLNECNETTTSRNSA